MSLFQFDFLSIILVFVLIFVFPRIMMYQILALLNSKVKTYEEMTSKSQKTIINNIGKRTKLSAKELRENIDRIMEHFVVEPDAIDPYGVANKIRYITKSHDKSLDYFVGEVTTGISEEERKNLAASLMHTIGLYQITKIIRHFIELIKETKNFQIGMILQIQLPFIDKQMKGLYQSVPAFINKIPVGDCIGPLYAAKLIGKNKVKEIGEQTVMAKKKIGGKEVFILKANGPAANLGEIDNAIREIMKNNKIDKVITVDASGKLKGEKTGKVAEGVGFAMGPRGGEKFFAESYLIEKSIPLEAVAIKMKPHGALMPMSKDILKSLSQVDEAVKRSLKSVKKKAIVVGIGLTVGVGNSEESAKEAEERLTKYLKKLEKERKKKEEQKGFFRKKLGDKPLLGNAFANFLTSRF